MPKAKKSKRNTAKTSSAKNEELKKSVPGPYNFKEVEESVLEFWKKNKVYEKAKKKNKGRKTFYFLDGPPYTSGKVHIGTAWNKALKDSFLRYKRMSGIDVWDRAGYDMHGLPTEHATEKKLGIKNKDEIPKFGVGKFVEECKKLSVENMELMNDDFSRLGVWMDFKDAYQSIKDEFIEGEWWLIKKAHENKRLYEGRKTMHWCASCATALAKHELEYKEIKDNSIFFKFKVSGSKNEYLIVWTTTPWTLAFNLAVMVNPELDYVRAKVDDEVWILSKALAGPVVHAVAEKEMEIIKEMKGEELKGIRYDHPWLDDIPALKELKEKNDKVHTVVLSKEYVDTSAGTGLVHCAPGCGPEDYEVGYREGLPAFNNIDEQGRFPEEMGRFNGLIAKKDDPEFIEALKEKGSLIAVTPVEHDYAHCWRCHHPVVFRTTPQWFFRIEDLKEKMKGLNKEIPWVPDWAGNRQFNSWLDNLRDNSITKQRFWGTPLPVWKCGTEGSAGKEGEKGCGNYVVVGTKAELKKLAGKLPKDLHKPWIDEITIKCSRCGKQMKRIPDILDVWVDAGCTSWICLGYPQKKDLFEKMFPADFILEGKDQIRGWFNLLFVASMVSMGKPSFKAVYMHGFVNDAQGRKMSKSLGNYILPQEVVEKYGADSFRYYLIGGANAGNDLNYNLEDVKIKHKNLGVLWNLKNFLVDMKRQGIKLVKAPKMSIEEKYIISRLNSAIKNATEKFERYNLDETPLIVESLFLDLSRTYIQLARDKLSLGSKEDKEAVMYCVYHVMLETIKLLAPICPFITERIYHDLKDEFGLKEESVHYLAWPKADSKMINEKLEANFDIANSILQSILGAREKSQLGLRWPLKKATIVTKKEEVGAAVKQLEDIIKVQANIKSLEVKDSMPGLKRTIRADYGKIGPQFGSDSPIIIANFSMMPAEAILKKIEEQGYYDLRVDSKTYRLKKEHMLIEKNLPKAVFEAEFRYGEIYIDLERTKELEAEGFAREIMRHVQQMRKNAGMQKSDRIELFVAVDAELDNMLKLWHDPIMEKVGADEILITTVRPARDYPNQTEIKIKGRNVFAGIEKV
ncbi:MAG: isoleucine--tRNA ligase [Candidatus Woesearchaeota archaeon]|nr:isoleucine--tRNA ligase [Candidatus Woesearchaeota archaeon]